ncbi:MAG: bacterial Ig-like domain-containing protein [Clostridia bacterium]|nr:bacterial Ig-like domain-containing protein [Clostridia bacterium]
MKKRFLSLGLAAMLLCQAISPALSVFAEDSTGTLVSGASADSSAETDAGTETPSASQEIDYTHEISDAGLELIKSFEGFTAYPVWDYKQYSYGYGSYCDSSTVYEDENSPTGFSTTLYPDGIPEREASELLRSMVDTFNVKLNEFLTDNKILLNQNQFDALASFGYNLGKYVWTTKDYAFITMLKTGEYLTDQEAFIEAYCSICHAGGQFLQGLYDRRVREMNIFFSEYSMSDPDTDLYVVNVSTTLSVRETASTSSARVGTVRASKVIRIHEYSADGKWGYTSYCGYYGWVNMDYLVSINEEEMVTLVGTDGYDDSGIRYTFDHVEMTATVGGDGTVNSSGYTGEYAGQVYLTKYVLYNNAIYTLTAISNTAFTGCSHIEGIYIPPSVTSIGATAFDDSTLQVIYYTDGSYAKTYAKASIFTATDERCSSGHTHSAWKVTTKASASAAQVEERTCSVCKETETRRHVGIEIKTVPSKTEYKEGQAFQQSGLTVNAVYSDGSRAAVTGFSVSGYQKNTLGTQTLTVSYSVFKTTFTVQVSAKSLTGIKISSKPSKLTYIEGQDINLSGLKVKAYYDNDTNATVTNYSVKGYDKNKIGTQTITVTYNGKTATFTVTVKAKSLTAIQIVDYPATMEYFCFDPFDTTGMRLKLSYDNGTTAYATDGFAVSGYDNTVPGVQTVTVSYGGKSQTMKFTVILNYLKSDKLNVEEDAVTGIPAGTTVAALRQYFESGDRIEVLKNGKVLPDTATVGTGYTVRLVYNGTVQDTATLYVMGDLTGDGYATVSDFAMLSDYLMGNLELSALAMRAGDLDGDGSVSLADYCALYPLTLTDDPAGSV